MKYPIFLALFCVSLALKAQTALEFQKIINASQKAETTLAKLTEAEQKESGVLLRSQTFIEYAFDSLGRLACHQGVLKRIRINDSKGLEIYNKIVLPVPNTADLAYLKARSILANGTVKEVGLEAVKEIEEQGRIYKILAVEGLEIGSELEYVSLFKRNESLFGSELLQNDIPARLTELQIISPDYLQFEAKVYNAEASLATDSLPTKRILRVTLPNIPAIYEEKYATIKANLVRLDYKLAYNLSRGSERLYTWEEASETFFNYLQMGTGTTDKAIQQFVAQQKLKGLAPELAIKKLENYFKTNIALKEDAEPETAAEVLSKQYGSKAGLVRLYVAALDALNIPYEVVVGSSRNNAFFDKDFDSWSFLDEFLLYFPQTKQYLDPANVMYRYGMIDQYSEGNYALFVGTKKQGKTAEPTVSVRYIPFSKATDNHDDLMADMTFSATIDQLQGKVTRTMIGQTAAQIRPIYHFVKAEQERKALNTEVIKSTLKPDAVFSNIQVKNINLNSEEVNQPFVISAEVSLKSVIERAGKKYLFKVGELIGPQVELYNERPRQSNIDMGNAHSYERILRIKIPQGYKLNGLEDIKRSITDGKASPQMGFVSNYKLENNLLTININEFYRQVQLPASQYDAFQKIINAAADFNKVTLVLEKI
jgi:transglutaminase-like putative cysteine protease